MKKDLELVHRQIAELNDYRERTARLERIVEIQQEKLDKVWGIVQALVNQVPGASRILNKDLFRDLTYNQRGTKRARFNDDVEIAKSIPDDIIVDIPKTDSLSSQPSFSSLRFTSSDLQLDPSIATSKPTFHRTYASEDSSSTGGDITKTMSSMSLQNNEVDTNGAIFTRSLSKMSAAAEEDYQDLVRLLSAEVPK